MKSIFDHRSMQTLLLRAPRLRRLLACALLAACSLPATAALNVVACEPEWASLASALGGDRLEVSSATTAAQD
ncbi:MAG: hypothetical protein ACREXI_11400, partial [Caldimonas sp.]